VQEFTVTDDTVLEEHCENPALVQMRILGEGGEDIHIRVKCFFQNCRLFMLFLTVFSVFVFNNSYFRIK
jgi:hypothetical protein